MTNIMLDPLPEEYEGLRLNTDFRIGLQLSQLFEDEELESEQKLLYVMRLLFAEPEEIESIDTVLAAAQWFLNGWNYDNHGKEEGRIKLLDFDIDQWRIYSAFLHYYRINLSTCDMHFWEFMGLLSNIGECTLTHIMDIRDRKPDRYMSKEQRKQLAKAQGVYSLQKKQDTKEVDDGRAREMIEEFLRQQGVEANGGT